MTRRAYPSDLTDEQSAIVQAELPAAKCGGKKGGRPLKVSRRDILDAILYVLRTGCAWRQMPHDFPHWRTVYGYYRAWIEDGTWERLNALFRTKVRERVGKGAEPHEAVIDSQSVKTALKGGALRATTRARRSTAPSATSSSIPSAFSSPS